jgi:hypothetical protein
MSQILCGPDRVLAVVDSSQSRPQGLVARRDLLRVMIALWELAAKRSLHEDGS